MVMRAASLEGSDQCDAAGDEHGAGQAPGSDRLPQHHCGRHEAITTLDSRTAATGAAEARRSAVSTRAWAPNIESPATPTAGRSAV